MKRFFATLVFLSFLICGAAASGQQLPAAVQDHLDRARVSMSRQQYDEAIGEIRSALKISNNCVDCTFQLLHAYQMVGAHKDALDTARKALEIAPNDSLRSAAHDAMGAEISELAKIGKMRHEDAEREFRTALQLNPDNMTANYNLGIELMRENRDADGIAVLTDYLRRAPEDSNAKDARLVIENPRRAREDFAPADFSVVTTNGEYVTLDDVKGKVVLLDFWASWCPPCISALPTLRGLAKRYSKDQFELISISVDQSEQAWRGFMAAHQMDWPQVLDRQAKLSHMFNVKPIPTYVLIDAEGIMRSYAIGSGNAAQLNDEVKKYLKNAQKLGQTVTVSGPSPASSPAAAPPTSGGSSAMPAVAPARNSDVSLGVAGLSSSAAASKGPAAPAANALSGKWQNVAPNEMWKRVTRCVSPAYPTLALSAHVTGTVNIGLAISPQGAVANDRTRVIAGPPLLVQPAMDAIGQWKFRPNVVQGEATWTRVRALVRFNADGTTAVDLAPGVLADDFGDPGTPPANASASPRPANSLECEPSASQVPAAASAQAPNSALNSPQITDGAGGTVVRADIGGVGHPVCIYCPQPGFSQAARAARAQGMVVLRVVVTAEGRATNIQVVNGPGFGLEENAVEAVSAWRFKPAIGPNGTPVAVLTMIEVTFALK